MKSETTTSTPYYYSERLNQQDASELADSLKTIGFKEVETTVDDYQATKILIGPNGYEILVTVESGNIEVISDYPAGPIIRDRG